MADVGDNHQTSEALTQQVNEAGIGRKGVTIWLGHVSLLNRLAVSGRGVRLQRMLRPLTACLFYLLFAAPVWAQPEVDALRVYLGTTGSTCTLHSGSGVPSTSLGAVCDVYVRIDSPYTVYSKTGASTWSELYRQSGTDVAVADGGTGLSSWSTGDLVYASGATTLAGITDTGAGSLLVSNSSIPGWSASPTVSGTFTAQTSLSSPIVTHSANLSLSPTGDLVTGPTGDDVLPDVGYTINLGALTNKYLTLHAAELWVETLVAQNTIATIGGRVLVGPTTTLTSDLGSGATSIVVKHNQMASGDRVYLEADGKVEFLAITSAPSGSGPYTYTITRNLDGTGANNWYAGDAVFNTGTTGDGFIDLYSISAVNGPTVYGPTIAGNVRTGTTYSDIAPRWAIGNLNGVYGYGADTYGAAFGDYSNSYLTVDATNGIRMIGDAGTMFSMDAAGNATFAGSLTVGTGRNLLSNTEFRREPTTSFGSSSGATTGTDGPATGVSGTSPLGANRYWLLGYYSGTGTPVWGFTCNATGDFPNGGGACAHVVTSGDTPSNDGIKQTYGPAFSAVAGQRYEFSFYASRTSGVEEVCPRIVFYDVSGSSLGTSSSHDCLNGAESQGVTLTSLSAWSRVYAMGTAPANTVQALPYFETQYDGVVATPKMYFTRMFFGEAGAGQTTPTPWAPGGVTLIDGEHLATDLVISNTIRSSGATALATGTGYWLDATGTPTFRVGNPSGNQIKWDGTDVTVTSTNLTVDSSGIRLTPSTSYAAGRSYTWSTASGTLAVQASDSNTTRSVDVFASTIDNAVTSLSSITAYHNTGPDVASVTAFSTNTASGVSISADTITATGEVTMSGIASDGTGKVACVKSNGYIGTCTDQPNGSGVCTCS